MLKKPVVTEVRTPTNTWSGLGFSKSMPAETIKELRRANHVSYKPSMSTTYEVRHKWKCLTFIIVINMFNILAFTDIVYIIRNIICLTVVLVDRRLCSVLGCTEFSLNLFHLVLRDPHCRCLDPAAGKAWGTGVTLTTGVRGTAPATA